MLYTVCRTIRNTDPGAWESFLILFAIIQQPGCIFSTVCNYSAPRPPTARGVLRPEPGVLNSYNCLYYICLTDHWQVPESILQRPHEHRMRKHSRLENSIRFSNVRLRGQWMVHYKSILQKEILSSHLCNSLLDTNVKILYNRVIKH